MFRRRPRMGVELAVEDFGDQMLGDLQQVLIGLVGLRVRPWGLRVSPVWIGGPLGSA